MMRLYIFCIFSWARVGRRVRQWPRTSDSLANWVRLCLSSPVNNGGAGRNNVIQLACLFTHFRLPSLSLKNRFNFITSSRTPPAFADEYNCARACVQISLCFIAKSAHRSDDGVIPFFFLAPGGTIVIGNYRLPNWMSRPARTRWK